MAGRSGLLVALEGGGTRSQAVLMDATGRVLQIADSSAVNTNFVPFEQAQRAVVSAVQGVLQSAGAHGDEVSTFVSSLVGPDFGAETFGELCPQVVYRKYGELRVVFARAEIYRPHGVGVVAATGATTWGVRADDHREVTLGGWGALLGDEGSAYAVGLLGLRGAVRAFEQRALAQTALVEAICQYFDLTLENFQQELIFRAYQKPWSRTEIARVASVVTRLATQADPLALRITTKVANDLAELALSAARRLFSAGESFDVVLAGGLINAGEVILTPFRQAFLNEYPQACIQIGREAPAIALGRLALYDIKEESC